MKSMTAAGVVLSVIGFAPIAAAVPPTTAVVEGDITLPAGGVEEPDVQHQGYVPRIKNPITELRGFDPRPLCFVYLEGGPAADDAAKPTGAVIMKLGVAAFNPPLLPVVLGTKVLIKNVSRVNHPIHSPDGADLLDEAPIGAGGESDVVLKEPFQPVRLRSRDAPHLEGRIVAVPTRYVARLDRAGGFKIDSVPLGKWTVKIWYRDGWLPTTQVVEVVAKGTPRVKITLPERLAAKAPGSPEKKK